MRTITMAHMKFIIDWRFLWGSGLLRPDIPDAQQLKPMSANTTNCTPASKRPNDAKALTAPEAITIYLE
jgi:hypothetical protein